MLAEKYYYLCWPTILQWIHTKRPPGSFHFLFFFSLYFNFCFMKQCVQNDFIRIINHKIDEMWIYVVRVCMFLCWSSSWSCVCLFLSYCFVSLLFIFHLCVFFFICCHRRYCRQCCRCRPKKKTEISQIYRI